MAPAIRCRLSSTAPAVPFCRAGFCAGDSVEVIMKLTRRQLATVLASATVAGAQQKQPAPAPPAPSDDLLETARVRMRANTAALATLTVPMAVEPAFQFKA